MHSLCMVSYPATVVVTPLLALWYNDLRLGRRNSPHHLRRPRPERRRMASITLSNGHNRLILKKIVGRLELPDTRTGGAVVSRGVG